MMYGLKFTLPDITLFLPDNLPGLKKIKFKPVNYLAKSIKIKLQTKEN